MFNLENYETVDERLEKFWEKYPDGRIATELVSAQEGFPSTVTYPDKP